MIRMFKYLCLCFTLSLILSSCLKKETYPDQPVIAYKSFSAYNGDKAQLVFSFTSGNGQIGLKSSENLNLTGPDTIYYYNLYLHVYYKNYLGQFVDTAIYYTQTMPNPSGPGYITVTHIDTGLIKQRIQYVPNTNKEPALKGEIYVDLNGYRQSSAHKIIKYKFYMYDRLRNKSNVAETPELQVP
ncbi:MAG TPA: hypothetical protein VNX68_19815 [Nitrosopumilaceae archaeon]|jgi:hypothetical protein|nr:hypothetical protein [Nitrosopumilaceae archaeon]